MGFKCQYDGLLLPIFGKDEMEWPNPLRLVLYLLGLGWTFLGVAVISDVFMAGIEKVTSLKKRVTNKKTGRKITVYVWNMTVANLTLMALGSSAPEILLSLIEITSDKFFLGPLGAGTIVGSAAFNLLCISAACVCSLPDGDVRYIKETHVYIVTASFSVFAYLWLMFILMAWTPDVCTIVEAVLTLVFCPILVLLAYLADRGYSKKLVAKITGKPYEGLEDTEDSSTQTIAEDATDEELMMIAKDIRAEHGENLTDDQVVKIMRAQFFQHRSRAYYRHAAMEASLHGKTLDTSTILTPESRITEVLNSCDDIEQERLARTVFFFFASSAYVYSENVGDAKMTIIRGGPLDCQATVTYYTVDGTATSGKDFVPVEASVTFEKDENQKDVFVKIVDDDAFEQDEFFTVKLKDPKCDDSKYSAQISSHHAETEVTILDDDQPGDIRFKEEQVPCDAAPTTENYVNIVVERFNGSTGKITCKYRTENMDAVDGVDFKGSSGTVVFEDGQKTATIQVVVNAKGGGKALGFNVVISEPTEGSKFDASTDGGEDECICHVTINTQNDQVGMLQAMKERVHSGNAIMGHKNWLQQFSDALFAVGDDDDEDEDGEEAGEKSGPGVMDYVIHIISVPWKLLFAFVPPVDYCGGWACFSMALVMIAGVTAIVGDMANLVGCCLDILPETAAITFVALGTSLPDTFASMAAAKMDPHADASIGNVTGSNSVNVFLGVGLAWALAAFRWETGEVDDEFTERIFSAKSLLSDGEKKNVLKAMDGTCGVGTDAKLHCTGKAIFVTPAGTLWFNLMVFSANAFFALQHLNARRAKFGGELGGPKKGFFGQYFSGAFLVFQWFLYVALATVFARMNDGLSYGAIASM